MKVPIEFTTEYIESNSSNEQQLFRDFLRSGEPFRSIMENNPWLMPPDIKKPLEWGTGRYWDTTVARKHDYWKDFDLPQATKDINQMRKDIKEWGFCLIEEAMSKEQCARFLDRLLEQAEGERLASVDQPTPSGQYINTLINKGEVELSTGNVAKLDEAGGLLALQIHMEGLNAAKDAMQGLAKLGLKNENKLWTLQ